MVNSVRKVSKRTALRRGVRFSVRCSEPAEFVARLIVPAALAKRLDLGSGRRPVPAGRTTRRFSGPGESTIAVALRRAVQRALREADRARLELAITATDLRGNATTTTRHVRIQA